MNILLNGVGRIGKSILRLLDSSFQIVAINEINHNIDNIAYSINYDSTYGNLKDKFQVVGSYIQNSIHKIQVLNYSSLEDIDYKSLHIDIVIDASGSKIDKELLQQLDVKYIFLTHPNKLADINVILGVNEDKIDKIHHKLISTSSCNATAILPLLKLIDDNYKILYGDITTIHPLLNHQKVLDSTCISSSNRGVDCSFEFGRSSTQNIIPSKTTTITACSYVLSDINHNRFSSSSLRVPTDTVGAINITLFVKQNVTKENIIELTTKYQSNQKYDIIKNNFEPLVSSDFKEEKFTTIIDHRFTDIKQNKMIKLVIWYDNEYGYASKVVDILKHYL